MGVEVKFSMFTRGRGGYPIEHMQTRGEEEGERGGGILGIL